MGVERKNNTWARTPGTGLPNGYKVIKELKDKDISTLADVPAFLEHKYGDRAICGTRKLIRRDKVDDGTKVLEKLHLGKYEWKSSRQLNKEVRQLASSFNRMGMKKGDRIAMLGETREDWLIAAMGAFKNGLTVVTLYTNLSDSGLAHGINETEIETIVTTYEVLPRLVGILHICPTIKNIVVMEDQLDGVGNTKKIPDDISVVSLAQLKGEIDLNDANTPTADDLAIIMYTSGSTGNPKGVEISHSNIFCAMYAYSLQADIGVGDVYLAYLPLAHIMELISEIIQLVMGSRIAYGSPLTLTNNSPKVGKGTVGDAIMARPTCITAVSLILDRITKAISLKVSKAGILQRKLFEKALRTKIEDEHSVMSKLFDAVVFKKVRAELGGRVKAMIVGGAPLSIETHNKIQAMFGCTVQCGYGCTETAASATSMQNFDTRAGHVGTPNNLTFIRLESWEEGGYLPTDTPYARGEIIIGGGCVARRYFKNEEETRKSFFDADGIRWFRTGDIGQFDESGILKIIDRKKDLVKLVNGEYVSLGGVESSLKTNCLVENICTFADSLREHPVCVVVPNPEPFLSQLKKEYGLKDITIEEACSSPKMSQLVLKELQIHGRKHGLNRWEIPQSVYLTPTPWTPESGLVTAAFKLRRRNLQNEYKTQIKAMYCK